MVKFYRWGLLCFAALSGACLGGCDRGPLEPQDSPRLLPKTPVAPLVGSRFRLPQPKRLVAIGDLHGDFAATLGAFQLAGAIDDAGHWIGGDLVVVQTGDQLDRGDDERKIFDFLTRLRKEAAKAGGALHILSGNHEIMNVAGDFRYVTSGARDVFNDLEPRSPYAVGMRGLYAGRAGAFFPGGGAARTLAKQPVILIVGDTVFAHGGVLPEHAIYGVEKLNDEVAAWMSGAEREPPELIESSTGPVWTRMYGDPQVSAAACKKLAQTLRMLSVRRMVVGHTVQAKGMSSACEDQVFRIDVGLASYYGDHPVQVLEMRGPRARILTKSEVLAP